MTAKAAAPYLPILDSVLDVDEPDHVERLCDLGRPVPDDLQALLGDGLGRDAAGGVACKSPPGALSPDCQSKRTCIVTGTSLADRSENSPRCCIMMGLADVVKMSFPQLSFQYGRRAQGLAMCRECLFECRPACQGVLHIAMGSDTMIPNTNRDWMAWRIV